MKNLCWALLACAGLGVRAQDLSEAAVKATVDSFFEGFHNRDTTAMKAVLGESVILQTVAVNPEGQTLFRSEAMADFTRSIASIPDTVQIEERLLDYKIRIDGRMAHAWTPYEFYLRGAFSHCGVNSFQMYHDGDRWRIIYIVDTRRRQGCQGQ